MLISVRKRFVFVANTKTASTSIEAALNAHCEIMRTGSPRNKHLRLCDVEKEYWFLFDREGHGFSSYFKFGVMRDPIDWIVSWFRYRKGNEVEAPLPPDLTFAEFWARKDWNILRANGEKYLQKDMFTDANGTLLADVILPYHLLAPSFEALCKQLNIGLELPRRNVSSISVMEDSISRDLREEMRAFYADDYAVFNRLEEMNAMGLGKLVGRG